MSVPETSNARHMGFALVISLMYRLKSIARYERPEGIEFAVPCPVKTGRNHECLSALFGPEVVIDRKKYRVLGFNVLSAPGPIKAGETVGVVVVEPT